MAKRYSISRGQSNGSFRAGARVNGLNRRGVPMRGGWRL